MTHPEHNWSYRWVHTHPKWTKMDTFCVRFEGPLEMQSDVLDPSIGHTCRERHFGSRVHMHPLLQMRFWTHMKCQKFCKKKNYSHIDLSIRCVHKVVSRKTDTFIGKVKKTKICPKIRFFSRHFLSSYTSHIKYLFSTKRLWDNLEYEYEIHEINFLNILIFVF